MNLPGKTSKLLSLKAAAEAELNARFAEVFNLYRALAFMDRNDHLFREHWTPEMAAAGYRFSHFEIAGDQIVLHGTEAACGFLYRISICFPLELVDQPGAISRYFEKKFTDAAAHRHGEAARNPDKAELPPQAETPS
jgi:hypothetical protein